MAWNIQEGLREFDARLQRFIKNPRIHVLIGLYFLCDILPRLPEPLAKKIVDKILSALGLGD